MRYRGERWAYEAVEVLAHVGNTLTLEDYDAYAPQVASGMFLVNHVDFISEPGDWAFDATNQTLYFLKPDPNFDLSRLRVTQFDSAFKTEYHTYGYHFDGLEFQHQGLHALHLIPSSEDAIRTYEVENCLFQNQLGVGIKIVGGHTGSKIHHNLFQNMQSGGISSYGATVNIDSNQFLSVGLERGNNRALNANASLMAVRLDQARDSKVRWNQFDQIGGTALSPPDADNTEIIGNLFKNSPLFHTDAGMIHAWGSGVGTLDGLLIEDNLFCEIQKGSKEDFLVDGEPITSGIYVDNRAKDAIVRNNLVFGNDIREALKVNAGAIGARIDNNILINAGERTIDISDYMAIIPQRTEDVQLTNNRVLNFANHKLLSLFPVLKISLQKSQNPPNHTFEEIYTGSNNTYYHFGGSSPFHIYYEDQSNNWSSIFTDTHGIKSAFDQETNSQSFSLLSPVCKTSQSTATNLLHYDPTISPLPMRAGPDTRSLQSDHLLLTLDPTGDQRDGVIFPSLDVSSLSGGDYELFLDFEAQAHNLNTLELQLKQVYQDTSESHPIIWAKSHITGRYRISKWFRIDDESNVEQIQPWLMLNGLQSTENFAVKLYDLTIKYWSHTQGCSFLPDEEIFFLINQTGEERIFDLGSTTYLDENLNPLNGLIPVPSHTKKMIFRENWKTHEEQVHP